MTHISEYSLEELERRNSLMDIQGYERTSYDDGVTRIKYRKVVKSNVYLLTGVLTLGTGLPWIALDALDRRTWEIYYFDTYSGNLFGLNDNKAAEAINKKGFESLKQGKLVEAKSLFNRAYNICEKNYSSEEKFRHNRDATGKIIDVQEILDKGQFSKAKEMYTKAYNESKYKNYSEFANCRDALDSAIEGINLLKKEQFMEAKKKFQESYSKCNFSNFCSTFATCRDLTKAASEGLEFFIQGRYSDSVAKFEEAINRSSMEEIKICDAINIFISAQNLLNEGRFNEAERHLSVALEKSNSKAISEIISNVLNSTGEKRKNAAKLCEDGKGLWNEAWKAENSQNADDAQNKFRDAKRKFEEAYNLLNHSDYNRWIAIVGLKIDGNESFNKAVKLQEEGNRLKERRLYQEAYGKYHEARINFQHGFNLSNDQRFNLCIEFIDDCIKESKIASETQERVAHGSNFTCNDFTTGEVQNETVEEVTYTSKYTRVIDRN